MGQSWGQWRSKVRWASAIALATSSAAAFAQSQPSGAPTREDLTRERAEPAPPSSGRLSIEGGIERAPCPLADPRFSGVTVRLGGVRFDGLEAVPDEALRPAWEAVAGREVAIATLCEIRDRAATILRARGYLAAVQIPPQRIEPNGTLRVDVLMARLTRIQIRGDAGNSAGLIERLLRDVAGDRPFNVHAAERKLLLARDLPGFDIRLVLRPATDRPGEITGEALVTREVVQADLNVQNLGSSPVGPYAGLARVQLNDLIGLGDATILSAYNTANIDEQSVLGIAHSLAIGANGLRFAADFTYAWSRPSIGTNRLRSLTWVAGAELSYPILRRQARTLVGRIGFEAIDQRTRFGSLPLTTDRLRTFTAALQLDLTDPRSIDRRIGYSVVEPRWRLGGDVELRQGLAGLGASEPCGVGLVRCLPPAVPLSRLAADPQATLLRFNLAGEFRPLPRLTFALRTRAQYSDQVLLSFEEIGAGNYTIGRGYDPGTLLGDSGVGVAAEIRLGSAVAHRQRRLALQPYAFFDGAWNWRNDAGPMSGDPQRILSTGAGVRGAWRDLLRFDATIAVPLDRAPFATARRDVRFLFTITTRLLPWRFS